MTRAAHESLTIDDIDDLDDLSDLEVEEELEEVDTEVEISNIIARTTLKDQGPIISSTTHSFGDSAESDTDRLARRPDISGLEDAIAVLEDGTILPLFAEGDRIVIERYSVLLPDSPWIDTQTFNVQSIDDVTGDLRLWNADLHQSSLSNFIKGVQRGFIFKLAPTRGHIGKKKRGRPSKNFGAGPVAGAPTGEKRPRGRPKGIKNRPKEVIEAEREAKSSAARAKAIAKRTSRV